MADEIKIPIKAIYDDKDAKKALKDAETIDAAKPELQISVGQQAANEIAAVADKMQAELRSAATAADALGQALGPELTAKVNMGSVIADLQKMGLTTQDIVDDADKLAASLRQLDQVNVKAVDSGLAPAVPTLDKLTEGAQKSRNALANMVGNTAQDLGALGGVAGSAGVALGQLAEGAADAGSLKDALTGAVPAMAGLAVATGVLQRGLQNFAKDDQRAAEVTKFHTAEIKSFTDAIIAGTDPVETYVAHLKEIGGIQVAVQGSHILGKAVFDVSEIFTAAGISAEQYATAVTGTQADMDRFTAAVKAANLSTSEQKAVLTTTAMAHDDYAKAQDKAAQFAKLFATSTGELRDVMDESKQESLAAADAYRKTGAAAAAAEADTDRLTTALEGSADAAERSATQHQSVADALGAEVDAMFGLGDASRQAEKAEDDFADAATAAAKAIKEHGAKSAEAAQATEDETDAAIAAAKAQAALTKQHDDAAGKTQSNVDKVESMNTALLNQARLATPAARNAIADYITEANAVPPDKVTDIKAAIARGDFDTAKAMLDEASAARRAAIIADAETTQAEKDLDKAARDRIAKIIVQAVGSGAALGLLDRSAVVGSTGAGASSVSTTTVFVPLGSQGPAVRRAGARFGNGLANGARR
jgi:hypothetical protein